MTLVENEQLREDSQFNQTILRNMKFGVNDYNIGVARYALKRKYFNMLTTVFDTLDIPKNLTLEERLAYYRLFVEGKTDD